MSSSSIISSLPFRRHCPSGKWGEWAPPARIWLKLRTDSINKSRGRQPADQNPKRGEEEREPAKTKRISANTHRLSGGGVQSVASSTAPHAVFSPHPTVPDTAQIHPLRKGSLCFRHRFQFDSPINRHTLDFPPFPGLTVLFKSLKRSGLRPINVQHW